MTSAPGAYAPAAAPITTVPFPGTGPTVIVPSAPRHRQPSPATMPQARGGVPRRGPAAVGPHLAPRPDAERRRDGRAGAGAGSNVNVNAGGVSRNAGGW